MGTALGAEREGCHMTTEEVVDERVLLGGGAALLGLGATLLVFERFGVALLVGAAGVAAIHVANRDRGEPAE